MSLRLVSIHGFDPRGPKVGGMETHVRQLLRRHPADMRILMVGLDDFGDLELGKVHTITVAGREIDFLPVMHIPYGDQTTAAKTVSNSVTFRFAKLRGANFRGADLSDADFTGAYLNDADFTGAKTSRTNFESATLTGVKGLDRTR